MTFANPVSYPELQDLTSSDVVVSTVDMGRPDSFFKFQKGKIIVYAQLGDLLRSDRIKSILDNNKGNNRFVFILAHDIDQDLINSDQATFIPFKNSYAEYSWLIPHTGIDFDQIKATSKTKHFLSLNNRAAWFRQGLFYFFKNFNLEHTAYLSYIGDLARTTYKSLDEIDVEFTGEYGNKVWYASNIDFAKIKKQIPYYCLETPNTIDWGIGDRRYYQDSFCSIVTETYSWEPYPFFTEKTFKPILFYQPFMLHSNPGSFAALRELGFKTFENWIDQDYDLLIGRERFEAMLHVILDISKWSVDKINKVYQEMMPVLDHNHNHFTKTLPNLYNKQIQEIKQNIQTIIQL